MVGEDRDVGAGEAGGGEDVDYLAVGRDRPGDELADGGVDLLGGFARAGGLFVEGGLQGLEEGDVVAELGAIDGSRPVADQPRPFPTGDITSDNWTDATIPFLR